MLPIVAIFGLGTTELIIILLVVILLFGAAKIPDLARSLGRAKAEYQKASREEAKDATPPPTSDEEKVIKAARELGIPTEGRKLADIKADVQRKLA